MARKRSAVPRLYALIASPHLEPLPAQTAETGSVRLGYLLDVIAKALEPYGEAADAVANAVEKHLDGNPDIRIEP